MELHSWFLKTAVFQRMHRQADGAQSVDNDFAARSFENVGAWILGRNMFGPIRGP
jgi:dihydrofolate reductase